MDAERLKEQRLKRKRELLEDRKKLPIYSAKSAIIEEIERNQAVVLVGETGSGKTTQMPQFIFQWLYTRAKAEAEESKRTKRALDFGSIAVTQPRRVAAVTVSRRVAEEMGVEHSTLVGHKVRFEDCTTVQTKIKFLTDGMLMREAILDNDLSKYEVIIIDEAHERTINTDVLLGMLKQLQKKQDRRKRKILEKEGPEGLKNFREQKFVIMSATLDADLFSEFFGAKILYIEGRQYPVEVFYCPEPQSDYIEAAMTTILQTHLYEPEGDILVFMTGREEIESLEQMLQKKILIMPKEAPPLLVQTLYAALPGHKQLKVFDPAPVGTRKVILATNIAETSLTINGIVYVIDSGLVKARSYNPRIGLETLKVVPVSKAAARQRTGRAGRERAGKCFRLYTENTFVELSDTTTPEIQRCNLENVILQMKAIGIEDIIGFPFIERPPIESIKRALERLLALKALQNDGTLSDHGRQMAELPLEPMYSKAILVAKDSGCVEEVLIIVSMLSVENIFYTSLKHKEKAKAAKARFSVLEGDHLTYLNIFLAYQSAGGMSRKDWCHESFLNHKSMQKVEEVRKQLIEYCVDMKLLPPDTLSKQMIAYEPLSPERSEVVLRALTTAFFLHAAVRQPQGFYSVRTLTEVQEAFVHPSSVLFSKKPKCVIFNELVMTTKRYMRDVSVIDVNWLVELAPHYYRPTNVPT